MCVCVQIIYCVLLVPDRFSAHMMNRAGACTDDDRSIIPVLHAISPDANHHRYFQPIKQNVLQGSFFPFLIMRELRAPGNSLVLVCAGIPSTDIILDARVAVRAPGQGRSQTGISCSPKCFRLSDKKQKKRNQRKRKAETKLHEQ